MKGIITDQQRHEKLIEFLSKFTRYQNLKIVKEPINSVSVPVINSSDINSAVEVFTDVLNITSGSVGNCDLYELLQAYLKHPECRDKINNIVKQALYQRL